MTESYNSIFLLSYLTLFTIHQHRRPQSCRQTRSQMVIHIERMDTRAVALALVFNIINVL